MEIRDWALRILSGDTLDEKFLRPERGVLGLTDQEPGDLVKWMNPSRPANLQIASRKDRKKLPSPTALADPEMRIRVLHTFANHELMAIELMAWALVAYPEAPRQFRLGLAKILMEEQDHTRLYMDRIEAHGAQFGDLPVNDHFWRCAESLTSPLKWVCAMNLTFEQANLDHAPVFHRHFIEVGDAESAAVMDRIEADEIHHVGFGAKFLKANTPKGKRTFETYVENLTFYNEPTRARGAEFNADARAEAGLDADFIERMHSL